MLHNGQLLYPTLADDLLPDASPSLLVFASTQLAMLNAR